MGRDRASSAAFRHCLGDKTPSLGPRISDLFLDRGLISRLTIVGELCLYEFVEIIERPGLIGRKC